jgi:hypothetical protein
MITQVLFVIHSSNPARLWKGRYLMLEHECSALMIVVLGSASRKLFFFLWS